MRPRTRNPEENLPARPPIQGGHIALACVAAMGWQVGAAENVTPNPDEGRGAALYASHCVSCHDSLMHMQGDRRTGSYSGVADKVRFYSELQRLEWTQQETDAVAAYLNGAYYHFPMPGVDEGVTR